MPHPTTVLRGAVTVVLGLLLALAPAAGFGGPAGLPDTDPVGVWPLMPQPDVVEGFDPPDSPDGTGHRGVDLAGAVGQPVRSALPGTVSYAARSRVGGVVVDHGPTRTTYEPVPATVSVGDRVGMGDRIGTLQLPGSHCFPRSCLPCRFCVRTGAAACRPFGNSNQQPSVAAARAWSV